MCVCFGVERFHTIFLRPNLKCRLLLPTIGGLRGRCALPGNLCVYRMQRTIFENSLHF